MHVDAAYGGFAVLTERGRDALRGLELADSVTLDPHKWLAMPFEVGCLMVREGAALERGLRAPPGVPPGAIRRDPPRGQLRRSRPPAHPGEPGDQGLAGARDVRRRRVPGRRRPGDRPDPRRPAARSRPTTGSSCVTPASLGVLTFRRRGAPGEDDEAADRRNEAIVARARRGRRRPADLDADRRAVRDPALRPEPHERPWPDVAHALERVATRVGRRRGRPGAGGRGAGPRARVAPGGHAAAAGSRGASSPASDLRRLPAFASVDDDQAAPVPRDRPARASGDRRGGHGALGAGPDVLRRPSRPPVGAGRRSRGQRAGAGRPLRRDRGDRLGPRLQLRPDGDGRRRSSRRELLAFPAAALRELMADSPAVDRAIRRIAQARLGTR